MLICCMLLLCMSGFVWCTDEISYKDWCWANTIQHLWAGVLYEKIKDGNHTKILDLRCGGGVLTAQLAADLPDVTVHGINPSNREMLCQTRDLYNSMPNLRLNTFSIADFLKPTTGHETYSGVVSLLPLDWRYYLHFKSALQYAYKALKPGGEGYFVIKKRRGKDEEKDSLTRAIAETIESRKWAHCFTREVLVDLEDHSLALKERGMMKLCIAAGFSQESIDISPVEKTCVFDSVAAFGKWLAIMSPYKKIAGDKHNELIEDVITEYQKLVPVNANGSIMYTDYMLYTVARK